MNERGGDFRQLGRPAADKVPLGIVFLGLLDRIVDADGVDAGDTGLHLQLGVVNAGFEIQKQRGEMAGTGAPVLPQVVSQKAHQHGPGAKVDIARGGEAAHARVDQRIAGAAFGPGGHEFRVCVARVRVKAAIDVFVLHAAFHFKLLNEMAVPVQPRLEGAQRPARAAAIPRLTQGLIHLPNAEVAPGQIGRQARTAFAAGFGFGHVQRVAPAACAEKFAQYLPGPLLSPRLKGRHGPAPGRGRAPQGEGLQARRGARIGARPRPLGPRLGGVHLPAPGAVPALAVAAPAGDPVAGRFVPGNARAAQHLGDAPVALEAQGQAGLLVGVERRAVPRRDQVPEHRLDLAPADVQRQLVRGKLLAQVGERFPDKAPVSFAVVPVGELRRFETVQQNQRPAAVDRRRQRRVVAQTQVALEPDHGATHRAAHTARQSTDGRVRPGTAPPARCSRRGAGLETPHRRRTPGQRKAALSALPPPVKRSRSKIKNVCKMSPRDFSALASCALKLARSAGKGPALSSFCQSAPGRVAP